MEKRKYLLGIILFLVAYIDLLSPLTEAAVLHYYAGPDYYSPAPGLLLELTDFKVTGPSSPKVGDTVKVEFKLRNWGQNEIEFAELGVFAAVRDPDNKDRSFGHIYKNKKLAVGKTIIFSSERKLDKLGTWKIWPSFQINLATGKKLGPKEWHVAVIKVEEILYPDLIVTEIKCGWKNNSVGYIIKNDGKGNAESGYYVALYVNNEEVARDYINVNLNPGQTYESWFKKYKMPECQDLKIKVCVDVEDSIKESNENNNCLETMCKWQLKPIKIVSGPKVVNITTDSALIIWATNIPGSSFINYSDRSSGFTDSVYDPKLVKKHSVLLKGLKPGTTYRYLVGSVDRCGGRVKSRTMIFETKPLTDNEKPKVKLILPKNLKGIIEIKAIVSDNIGVSHVSFSIDGVVKFTDFSPPYIWILNTSLHENGLHSFTATAYDLFSNKGLDTKKDNIKNPSPDTRPPLVSIIKPPNGKKVIGMVEIEAFIRDTALAGEPTGYITKAEIYIDGNLLERWVYTPFRYNFLRREIVPNPRSNSLTLTYLWNTTGLEPDSTHTIEVFAWDDSGNRGKATTRVTIATIEYVPPPLKMELIDIFVEREVERRGNYFLVTLSITNTGSKTLSNFQIIDEVRGFQAIPLTSFTQVFYDYDLQTTQIVIAPHPEAALRPGGVSVFQYIVVPILFHPVLSAENYVIGTYTSITLSSNHDNYMFTVDLPYSPSLEDDNRNGLNDLNEAFAYANFLIVTNPSRLFNIDNHPERENVINHLLWKAAKLAMIKRGVLGYLDETSREQFKALISPGGEWANKLSISFTIPVPESDLDAYLLIIGETEIVPSYEYIIPHGIGGDGHAKLSDNYFGDTTGDGAPDLIVGRIIGRNGIVDGSSSALLWPIDASISVASGHGFDTDFAVALAGYETSGGDPFVPCTMDVINDMVGSGYTGENIYWNYFVEHEWNIDFIEGDAFVLGDVDDDDIEEIIVASTRGYISIYKPDGSFMNRFPCIFNRRSGLAAGNLDDDGIDEIVVALNDGDRDILYVYKPDGTLLASCNIHFDDWDAVAVGDLVGQYDIENREEIVIAQHSTDRIWIYGLSEEDGEWEIVLKDLFDLPFDFTAFDGFAIGNVRSTIRSGRNIYWDRDEIVIVRDDDETIYIIDIYDIYGKIDDVRVIQVSSVMKGDSEEHVRFTHYDGLAIGDVDGDRLDDIVIIIDEDDAIYRYYWDDTVWRVKKLYSRFFDINDWFHGIRYTGRRTRYDCIDIGTVVEDPHQRIVILRNRNGPTSSYYELVSTSDDADELANKRFSTLTPQVSIVIIYGHGNPYEASPTGKNWKYLWNFEKHPIVYSFGCETGDYEPDGDYSFGEAFFEKGAAVFIGSTELVGMWKASWTITNIFDSSYRNMWNLDTMSAGKAFTIYERDRYHEGWIHWICEWNYYGDPKFPGRG